MQTVLLSSAYLPPVHFFQAMKGRRVLIEQYDNYRKQTLRNRCLIATSAGIQALTIPVVKSESPKQLVKDVRISDHGDWRHQHWTALESAYMNSPFFMYYQDDFRPFFEKKFEFLIDFNMGLTRLILELAHMDVDTSLTERYYDSLDVDFDIRESIEPDRLPSGCELKPYWQVFQARHGFQAGLSAVDLLFNMGPEFKTVL